MKNFSATFATSQNGDRPSAPSAEAKLKEQMAQLHSHEARYQRLVTDLQIGILIQLSNSEIVMSNPKALELLGLSEDQLLGKSSLDPDWNVIYPNGSPFPGPNHPVPQAIATGKPVRNVVMGVYRPKSKDRVWLLVNAAPQFNADGSMLQVVCTFSDLPERPMLRFAQNETAEAMRVAEVLREKHDFTQAVLNSVEAEIVVISKDGTILAVNEPWQRFAATNRLSSGDLPHHVDLGANYLEVCRANCEADSNETTEALNGIQAVLEGRTPSFSLEYPCHSPHEQRWFLMHVTALGGVTCGGVVISHTNITQRKVAEFAQAAKELELAEAQHVAHMGSWYWDVTRDEVVVSDELLKIVGLQQIPQFNDQCGTLYSPATWHVLNEAVQLAIKSGVGYNLELPAIKGDGTAIWINTRCNPIIDADGQVIALRGTVQDITERKQIAAKLKLHEQRLQLALDATSDGLWDWDLSTGAVYRSPRYHELIGIPPEDDTHDFDFFKRTVHPQDWAHVFQNIQAHRSGLSPGIAFEYRLATAGNKPVWLRVKGKVVSRDSSGKPLRMAGMLSDITEQKVMHLALQEREQQLARFIEGSDQGYWDLNVQTRAFHVSAREEEMLGYTPGEMNVAMEHWAEHIHPDDYGLVMESIAQHIEGKSASSEMEIRLRTKHGGWRWIFSRGRIVTWDEHGQPLMMSGTHTDITERKNSELALREAATVFTSSYEGIMVVSPELRITKVNPAFTRITGYTAEEAVGQTPQMLSSGKHDARFYRQMWDTIKSESFWSGEIWDRRKNGELYAALLSITAVRQAQGGIQHYVGVFSDISKFKAHEEELDRVAHYDPLTGSPNRRLLKDRFELAIHRATRTGRSLAVCFLDIDGFKAINDLYGTQVGDQLLVAVNDQLQRVLRADDTLARLGGDEFVLLLSEIASPEECVQILERLLQAVRSPVTVNGISLAVTGSVGVSLYPDDQADPDTLLRHADQAMYQAKEAGKNRYRLFDPENDRKAQAHRQYLQVLRQAFLNDEFELFYQPKVDLSSGAVVGAEALIRWRCPVKGLISPAEFLPHIYGSDLETPLGEWVIQTALAQAAVWHRMGMKLCVSANISAHHLLQPGFQAQLAKALAGQADFPSYCFELEVLETAAIADMELAVSILSRCRELGVHFALDDFGTGYSSLTYLRKLPIDTLKIDQSFVLGMLDDTDDRGIVESVIRLGETFKRHIIAEGVETMAHASELLRMGCHLAQGYGIARPMPSAHFFEWSQAWEKEAKWQAGGRHPH
nr:EAL domain-containing protein [uncultured Rhodoferax sp.]